MSRESPPKERLPQEAPEHLEMIGTCPDMRKVYHLIRKVAHTDFPVLIAGASGTGKEIVAHAIHRLSPRAPKPFVVVNCGGIPRELLESEFFGHEKGAFTGAHIKRAGKVELAHHGTLFLDEVGELPLELQVKLLRFLQDYTFERVGGREGLKVDVRVISATNRDLKEAMAAGSFRQDLYYRLDGLAIHLPDLKDRGKDILTMAQIFLHNYAATARKEILGFTDEAEHALNSYDWPGNIRELINRVRRAVVLAEDAWVTPENLGLDPGRPPEAHDGLGLKEAVAQFEAKLLAESLCRFQGNIQRVAKALKTSRSRIYHLIKKYDFKEYLCAALLFNTLELTILSFLMHLEE